MTSSLCDAAQVSVAKCGKAQGVRESKKGCAVRQAR